MSQEEDVAYLSDLKYIRDEVDSIEGLLPEGVSETNKLADRNFVNNQVATNSANYISYYDETTGTNGPFPTLQALQEYSGPLTNNDYAFVATTDASGDTIYTRYKYNADEEQWGEEYVIHNPTFSANQWDAINSGINSEKVEKLDGIESGAQKNVGKEFTAEEKDKLSGIAEHANNYTLPIASDKTLGGIKVGKWLSIREDGTLDSEAPPVDISGKLDSTSVAPAFSPSLTYELDEYVTYNGKLYICTDPVVSPGEWTGNANWGEANMTSPDATLDISNSGQLKVIGADGGIMWAQGYDLAAESSSTIRCRKINLFTFADGASSQAFSMPTPDDGKVGDLILDVDNSANSSAAEISITGLDLQFSIVVRQGESLTEMLYFEAGEMAELYFTQTSFRVNGLPTWKCIKQIVENGGAQT